MTSRAFPKTCRLVSDALSNIADTLSSLGLIISLTLMLLQVILRYVFNSGIIWVEEITKYTMIWVALLIGGTLVKNEELIKVDFLDSIYPPKFIKYRNAVYQVLYALVFLTLIVEGLNQAISAWVSNARMTTINISYFWVYLSVPIGAFMMAVQNLISFVLRNYDVNRVNEKR